MADRYSKRGPKCREWEVARRECRRWAVMLRRTSQNGGVTTINRTWAESHGHMVWMWPGRRLENSANGLADAVKEPARRCREGLLTVIDSL